MKITTMQLKILLPYRVFAEVNDVIRIVVETSVGSYGILPQRLDCTAALVTGILMFETASEGEKYIAVNEGNLIKTADKVLISVRHAIGDAPLDKLKDLVEREMIELDVQEVEARSVMAKLETGFMRNFQKMRE